MAMRPQSTGYVDWILAILSLAAPTFLVAEEPEGNPTRPFVGLSQIPIIKLDERAQLTQGERDEIDQLIEDLSDVADPQVGLLGTVPYESVFVPVGVFGAFGQRYGDRKVEAFPALKKLVELGPKALPQLLIALENKHPTKLVITDDFPIGQGSRNIWFDDRLVGNPANPLEQRVMRLGIRPWTRGRKHDEREDQVEAYRVKVGDVCLAAVGQIVARDYQPLAYYHPKVLDVAVNSPVHNRSLRNKVRTIWASNDSTDRLLHSLLLDYSTRGIWHGEGLDEWGLGNDIQIEAAKRLLYYFPSESAPLIADRLDRLDVSDAKDFIDQCLRNGVRADEFVDAVGWTQEKPVREALERLVKRAKDGDVLEALQRAGIKAD